MKYVYEDKTINMPLEYFARPATVSQDSVCEETKQLARPYCPKCFAEYFTSKMRPDSCSKHTSPNWREAEDTGGIITY